MKIYGRKKLIIGVGMLMLAVLLVFTTVLSGRIRMPSLLSGAALITVGINAIYAYRNGKDCCVCREEKIAASGAVLFIMQMCCIIAVAAAVIVYTASDRYTGECVGIMLTAGIMLVMSFLLEWAFEVIFGNRKSDDSR